MYYQGGFFDGFLEAAGGIGDVENGAAGTVYVEKAGNNSDRLYRTLKVDNKGRSPLTARINQVHNDFSIILKEFNHVILCHFGHVSNYLQNKIKPKNGSSQR